MDYIKKYIKKIINSRGKVKKLTKQSDSKLSEAEKLCFRQAMQELNVKPLKNNNDEILSNLKNDSKKIAPYPVFTEQKFYAEQQNSHNLINFSLQNLEDFSDFDYFDDFRKNGVQLQVLKNLRKGKFPIQAQIDLHGFDRQQALYELSFFLDQCLAVNLRCIKIIHGKGSANKKPVLKNLTKLFLQNHSEVLAFCYAKPNQGGEGAVIALLRN